MNQEQFKHFVSTLTQVNNYINAQCAAHAHCSGCPLILTNKEVTTHLCDIGDLSDEQIIQLIQIMNQKQLNTRLSSLIDTYPKTRLHYKTNLPYMCCGQYFNFTCPHNLQYDMFSEQCERCWLTENK